MSDDKPFNYYMFTFMPSGGPSTDLALTFCVKHNGGDSIERLFSNMVYIFQLPSEQGINAVTEIAFPASQLHSIRKYTVYSNTIKDKDFATLERAV